MSSIIVSSFLAEIIVKYTLIWLNLQEGKAFFVKNIRRNNFLIVHLCYFVLQYVAAKSKGAEIP
jgi:hypothetical protein